MATYPEPEPLSATNTNQNVKQPSIAVVVTTRGEINILRPCLASLASHCAEVGAKLVVAHAGKPPNFAMLLGAERMSLTFVTAPAGTSNAELRRIGAERCGRNIVAFVDDFDRVRIDWIKHLCGGWQARNDAGGRVAAPSAADAEQQPPLWPRPRLSIVVPVHNNAATLQRALEASLAPA